MFCVPVGEVVFLGFAIIAAGIVAGLFAGLLGIGGAAVTVPVLYELFRVVNVPDAVRMQLCVGTSLAIIIPVSIRSFLAHKSHSAVRLEVLKVWAVPVVLGVLSGSAIAYVAPSSLFRIAFLVFGYGIGLKNLIGNSVLKLGDELPGKPALAGAGYLIGLFSSLIGVAGGAMSTLFLTLFGETIHVAIATSSGLGVLISVPGAIGYVIAGWSQRAQLPPLSLGYVSLLALLLFTPVSVLVAPFGAKLAHRLSRRKLEIAFGLFLCAVATRFLISLF